MGETEMNHIDTLNYFDAILSISKDVFLEKLKDYGPSWLILRWNSLVDQIWIKAKRIRNLEENNENMLIPESRDVEYIGIINYSVVALMKLWFKEALPEAEFLLSDKFEMEKINISSIEKMYDEVVKKVRDLLIKKNHDYGEAWKDMEISSITDQILVKLLRIKRIIALNRETKVSENIDAHFSDIINYCVFALIKLFNLKTIEKNALFEYCRFCAPPDKDRILLQAKNFYVMLSLGPIIEGYLLIIPYQHLNCFGELPKSMIEEFISIKKFIINIYKKVYNTKKILCFEHGRVATSIGLPPNDFHAHMHCIPLTIGGCDFVREVKRDLNIEYYIFDNFIDFWENHRFTNKNESYLYINIDDKHYCFYIKDKPLRPQYLRYVLTKCMGINEKYADWMKYPMWEIILKEKILLQPHFLQWGDKGEY